MKSQNNLFVIMHKTSQNEIQQRRTHNILLVAEIIIELFMIYITVVELRTSNNHNFSFKIGLFAYIVYYFAIILISLLTKKNLVPSIMLNIAFLYGFTYTFLHGSVDIFGSLWMIIMPSLSMYIANFAVSFWSCFVYGVAITIMTFHPASREILLNTYTPIFLSRYYIIYWIDFFISAAAMLQLHVMRYNQNRYNDRLENAIRKEREKVSSISMQTILSINNAVQAKDLYTGQHSQRVAHFACLTAEKLGWPQEKIRELNTIALLHDIGKIGVDENILNKPSKLSDDEYSQMKQHTVIGGNILKGLTLIPNVDLGAAHHHERYDGNGYPEKLKGENIPIEARIIGIADAFDAMSFSRVYRQKCDLDYVKNEIIKGKGSQFDPKITDAFIQVCDENNWFRDFKID